jgi:hypothetical protein
MLFRDNVISMESAALCWWSARAPKKPELYLSKLCILSLRVTELGQNGHLRKLKWHLLQTSACKLEHLWTAIVWKGGGRCSELLAKQLTRLGLNGLVDEAV